MTKWVVHFVHDFEDKHFPDRFRELCDGGHYFPYAEEEEAQPRHDMWDVWDSEYPWQSREAFGVLLKIVADGHIRCGWAFRRGRPTIYGPRAACCFTEMPLYALLDYAQQRSGASIRAYGICLRKDELFQAGGRPVIYGLSSPHKEVSDRDWPRYLHPDCGLALQEQYRYVSMSLAADRHIDWSHEREWRWCDQKRGCDVPGLPVWLRTAPHCFSSAVILVNTSQEADQVLDALQRALDGGWHEMAVPWAEDTLRQTKVVALEEVRTLLGAEFPPTLRLEDVPAKHLQALQAFTPSRELKAHVRAVVEEARVKAVTAASRYRSTAMRGESGLIRDMQGWAHVVLDSNRSELAQAMLELKVGTVVSGVGYVLDEVVRGAATEDALAEAEAAAQAALDVLQQRFPEAEFRLHTRWD